MRLRRLVRKMPAASQTQGPSVTQNARCKATVTYSKSHTITAQCLSGFAWMQRTAHIMKCLWLISR